MAFNLYLVRNLVNGKMYCGKTTYTIERRWKQHKYDARRQVYNSHLHRAMRKYGPENFVIDPIIPVGEDIVDEQGLNAAEMLFIRLLRINCELMNLTDGGEGTSG